MFPPGRPQPIAPPQQPPGMAPPGMPGMQPPGMMPPPAMPPQQQTGQLGFGSPMMPESDPNALLAALLGGNDALGNNLMALFQMRQQNPNASGDAAGIFQPPQPTLPQPMQSPGGPMSMMPGLPF